MKHTKHKLLSSIATLFVCLAMFIGSTYAWFTDSASTGVNKIQAGNLDIQLLDKDGNSIEGKTLKWEKATDSEEEVLWEPGATYYTDGFQIKNAGNLALKFKITINGVTGNTGLLNAIDFYLVSVKSKNLEATNAVSAFNSEYHLAAGESWKVNSSATSSVIYLAGHMKEDAGNEYQGLSLDNIGITLAATQDTVESDSFDSNYDERSIYPVIPTLNNITLTGNITASAGGILGNLTNQNSPTTAAQIFVPDGAVGEDTNAVFSIQLKESTPDSTTYEISLKKEGTDDPVTLSTPAVVTANIGTNLINVKVKHSGEDMAENTTEEDGTYQYNRNTGILTIYTKTFSPFQITYEFDGVASLNGVSYPSINAAINAAKDGDTIVLLDNTSMTYKEGKSCISIDNKDITIDGNGKVITLSAESANYNTYGIYITGDSSKTVTIKNTKINTTNLERAIRTEGSIGFKIENSTIKTNGVGVHVKGNNKVDIRNTQITVSVINNEVYKAHLRTAVMVGGVDADVTVNGCTINAVNENKTTDKNTLCKGLYVGSYSKNAKITANDTNVVADFSIAIDGAQDDHTQSEGKPTQIIINSGEYSGLFGSPSGLSYKSLIINGGTFTGIENYNSFYGKYDPVAKLVISGGTFNVDPSLYVADGHEAAKDESKGTWTVSKSSAE